MRGCLQFLAFLVLFVTVIIIVPVVACGYGLIRSVTDPATYKQMFNEDFYRLSLPIVLDSALRGSSNRSVTDPQGSSNFNQTLSAAVLDKIPADLPVLTWLKETVDAKITDFVNWTNGLAPSFDLTIDTAGLRKWLGDRASVSQIAVIFMEGLPTCTTDQESALVNFASTRDFKGVTLCNPTDSTVKSGFVNAASGVIASYAENMPAKLDLNQYVGTQASGVLAQPIPAAMGSMGGVILSLFLCPGALILTGVAMGARSRKGFFAWLGWSLLIGAALVALFGQGLVRLPVLQSLRVVDTEGSQLAANVAGNIFSTLTSRIGNDMLIVGMVMGGIGAVCVLLSAISRRPDIDMSGPSSGYSPYQKAKNDQGGSWFQPGSSGEQGPYYPADSPITPDNKRKRE